MLKQLNLHDDDDGDSEGGGGDDVFAQDHLPRLTRLVMMMRMGVVVGVIIMMFHKIADTVNVHDVADDGEVGADDVGGDGGDDHHDEIHLVASQSREESRVGVRRKRRVYVLP